jgi:hypothetical protein
MTAFFRASDDQDYSKSPPTNRNNPLEPASPANDNEGPWPLVAFPENTPTVPTAPSVSQAAAAFRHALRGKIVVVAYGIVAFTATIAWFYLLGLTMLSAVEWVLSE